MISDSLDGVMGFFSLSIQDYSTNFGISAESEASANFYGERLFYPNIIKSRVNILRGKYCETFGFRQPSLPDREIVVTCTTRGLPNSENHPMRVIDSSHKIGLPIGFGTLQIVEDFKRDEIRLDLDFEDHSTISEILLHSNIKNELPVIDIVYWVNDIHVLKREGQYLQLADINRPAEIVVTSFTLRQRHNDYPSD